MNVLEEGSSYYNDGNTGIDPFISGDLEINNEAYNNPAVMVIINSFLTFITGYSERASTL